MTKPCFVPASSARILPPFGGDIRLTMPADGPQAGFSAFEDVRQPGDGPPLHVHHGEDQMFRVISGRFKLRAGDETVEAGPGDSTILPRDLPHSFVNSGEEVGTMLCIVEPGGFERFFLEIAEAGLQVPTDMGRIVEVAVRYRLGFLGPNPFSGR